MGDIEKRNTYRDDKLSGYNLPIEERARRTHELLNERPPVGDERFVCYMIEGEDPLADIGRSIECEVFEKSFGNNAREMQELYGPYEEASTFFISVDREGSKPTGVLRVIRNSSAGLMTLNDVEAKQPDFSVAKAMEHYGMADLDDCWDIGTVAVPEEYRSANGVSLLLYRGMYVASKRTDIKHFVSVIDEKPFKKMTNILGFPFKTLYGTKPMSYLGSKNSIAVYGDAPKFEEAVRRKEGTIAGFLARKALAQLGRGTKDGALQF